MRWWQPAIVAIVVVLAVWATFKGEKTRRNWYANHVLTRCEEDAEFRERLRKALGVKP